MSAGRGKSHALIHVVLCCASAIVAAVPALSDDYPPYRLVSSSPEIARRGHPIVTTTEKDVDGIEERQILYPDRLNQAYTVVLPGVFGTTPYNTKLIRLLKDAPTAVEYYDWTKGVPLFMRRGVSRNPHNSASAAGIAARIMEYQDQYPGCPVHVIALCAGAGPACEALGLLPEGRAVQSAILLGPALSPDFDLRPALRGTQHGIDSFHSPLDIPVLMALTTVVGTMDGQHLPAAGAIGFLKSEKEVPLLRQHMYNPKMLMQGHLGGHFGWTATKFVDRNVIPILDRHQPARETSK